MRFVAAIMITVVHFKIFILAIGLIAGGCGSIKEEPDVGPAVKEKIKEHAGIGIVRGKDIDCIAFLADREDQAITPTNCVTNTVWFQTSQGVAGFDVINVEPLSEGLSRLTLNRPVNPYFFKLEVDYDGWDEKKGIGFFMDSFAECETFKDGRHYCEAGQGSSGAPIVDASTGIVIGVHRSEQRCPEAGVSCKYTPIFLLQSRHT